MAGKSTYYGGIYGAREWSINADTANTAIDLSQSNVYNISLSANTTISFLNPTSTHYIFVIEQTVGSNTITWPDIKWKSGVPPTLSTTIGSKDTISIIYDGEEYYGFSSADYQTGFRLLDYYPDAAAAYSLRELSQEWIGQPVVRVRRSSDNAEADFTAAEVADGTMTAWVNTEVVVYTSDFTFGNEDLLELNGTGSDGETIGGVSDAYKFTADANIGATQRAYINSIYIIGQRYRLEAEYYIPSGQTLGSINFNVRLTGGTPGVVSELDQWTPFVSEGVANTASPNFDIVYSRDDGDVFYLKNIVVTQTTADGHVVTWYDQSGNGNDATQATAANQPKIVDAGVLVTDNSKPAIYFDGVDDNLRRSSIVINTNIATWAAVVKPLTLTNLYQYFFNSNVNFFGVQLGSDGFLDRVRFGDGNSAVPLGAGYTWTKPKIFTANINIGGDSECFIDGVSKGSSSGNTLAAFTGLYLGMAHNNTQHSNIHFQEFVLFDTNQSANRTAIEQNINNHYNIYP